MKYFRDTIWDQDSRERYIVIQEERLSIIEDFAEFDSSRISILSIFVRKLGGTISISNLTRRGLPIQVSDTGHDIPEIYKQIMKADIYMYIPQTSTGGGS